MEREEIKYMSGTRIFTDKRKEAKRCFERVSGPCLEKLGLHFTNGTGYVILDTTVEPRIGDLVHCDDRFGTIHGFIKQIRDIKDGVYIVGTAYEDSSKDFAFEASVIYGVVTYVFDAINHNQLYERK